MAWSQTDTNILVAGFDSIKLKAIGNDAYYAAPFHGEGSLMITPFTYTDARLRRIGVGGALMVTIKFRMYATDVDNLIDKLGLGYSRAERIHVKLTCLNGNIFNSEDIGANGYFGCEAELVVEGGYEGGARYVDVTLMRACEESEFETAIASAQADGTPNASDDFYHLSQMTIADIESPAATVFQFREASSSTWDDTIGGNFNSFTLRAKFTGPADSLGRIRATHVDIAVSVVSLQTGSTEYADLANYNKRANEVRVTFPDAYAEFVSTSTSGLLGWTFSLEHSGNIDATATIKIEGQGKILLSEWAGVWTDGTPP